MSWLKPLSSFSPKFSYQIIEVISITMVWFLGATAIAYIKFSDVPNNVLMSIYHIPRDISKMDLYRFAMLIGIVLGLLMSLAHIVLYPIIVKSRNFALGLMLRSIVFLIITISALYLFLSLSGSKITSFNQDGDEIISTSLLNVLIYLIIIEVANGVNLTLRRNLGKQYFHKLIRNTYFSPKLEHRVFMFIDLKDSTKLVEKMGSLKFSRFIQKCFGDFSETAMDYGAEVYQYVGDEVIVTWLTDADFDYHKCIDLHYSFLFRLQQLAKNYLSLFGTMPVFRSSVHCGSVSAALVGTYKSDIAYHGGVLNLCSRIQTVCRQYACDLIVSDEFRQKMPFSGRYEFEPIPGVKLKGIAKEKVLYKVSRNANHL